MEAASFFVPKIVAALRAHTTVKFKVDKQSVSKRHTMDAEKPQKPENTTTVAIDATVLQQLFEQNTLLLSQLQHQQRVDDAENSHMEIWKPIQYNYVASFLRKCISRMNLHEESARYYERRHKQISIPATVLGVVTSGTAFSQWSDNVLCEEASPVWMLVGGMMALATILHNLSEYVFGWKDKSRQHHQTYINFSRLVKRVGNELNNPVTEHRSYRAFIESVSDDYDRYTEHAPVIPSSVDKKMRERYMANRARQQQQQQKQQQQQQQQIYQQQHGGTDVPGASFGAEASSNGDAMYTPTAAEIVLQTGGVSTAIDIEHAHRDPSTQVSSADPSPRRVSEQTPARTSDSDAVISDAEHIRRLVQAQMQARRSSVRPTASRLDPTALQERRSSPVYTLGTATTLVEQLQEENKFARPVTSERRAGRLSLRNALSRRRAGSVVKSNASSAPSTINKSQKQRVTFASTQPLPNADPQFPAYRAPPRRTDSGRFINDSGVLRRHPVDNRIQYAVSDDQRRAFDASSTSHTLNEDLEQNYGQLSIDSLIEVDALCDKSSPDTSAVAGVVHRTSVAEPMEMQLGFDSATNSASAINAQRKRARRRPKKARRHKSHSRKPTPPTVADEKRDGSATGMTAVTKQGEQAVPSLVQLDPLRFTSAARQERKERNNLHSKLDGTAAQDYAGDGGNDTTPEQIEPVATGRVEFSE